MRWAAQLLGPFTACADAELPPTLGSLDLALTVTFPNLSVAASIAYTEKPCQAEVLTGSTSRSVVLGECHSIAGWAVSHQDPETEALYLSIAITVPDDDLDPVVLSLRKPTGYAVLSGMHGAIVQDLLAPAREDVPQL